MRLPTQSQPVMRRTRSRQTPTEGVSPQNNCTDYCDEQYFKTGCEKDGGALCPFYLGAYNWCNLACSLTSG